MSDLLVLGAVALGIAVAGMVVGMLAAPAMTRWTERDAEEPDGDS